MRRRPGAQVRRAGGLRAGGVPAVAVRASSIRRARCPLPTQGRMVWSLRPVVLVPPGTARRKLTGFIVIYFTAIVVLVVTLVMVSRPFPSWNRSILTEIYLCHACSWQEILRTEMVGQAWMVAQRHLDADDPVMQWGSIFMPIKALVGHRRFWGCCVAALSPRSAARSYALTHGTSAPHPRPPTCPFITITTEAVAEIPLRFY
eukprot:COSAG01_NODE_533_length_15816_cov_4.518738_4_plen_203_part_00